MKKILFVLAFAFIGQQAFSQMYMIHIGQNDINNCGNSELTISKIDPTGNATYSCVCKYINPAYSFINCGVSTNALSVLNQEFNSLISLGYKLVYGPPTNIIDLSFEDKLSSIGSIWIFAIPWNASGLEEVPTTLNSLSISPNPANEFVNISLSYDLKGESEIVFISEAGYVYHKESVGSISKNETYNIDISRIPAGKYLVTIKNGKSYTTPQKLIIL